MSDRPKVGPADPETRRKMLRATLDAEAAEGAQRRAQPKPKKKRTGMTLGEALNPRVKRESAHNGETVDEVVKRAIDGAPKP